jgi:hypothetical protein
MTIPHAVWLEVDRVLSIVLGVIHLGLGLAVLLGGPERFPSPNYDILLKVTEDRVWPYGVVWIIGGLLMVIPCHTYCRMVGMCIIIFIANVWAAFFGVAAYEDPTASFTPTVAYEGYAVMNATLLWLTWIHMRQEHEVE